jgi:hypothetical protein
MRKLPLATLGAVTALGLLAASAQAEPVKLSLAQMDELTAGEASANASAQASSSASASASAGPEGGTAEAFAESFSAAFASASVTPPENGENGD